MVDVYEVITSRIIGLLEKGTVPWHKPWGGPEFSPRSLVTEKHYRGINAFMLNAASFSSPYWLTYKQAKERGGSVKKGEKASPCIYWNWVEYQAEDSGSSEKTVKKPFLKYYSVFNVEQCENVPYPVIEEKNLELDSIKECEAVVNGMPKAPPIIEGGNVACYVPSTDRVHMPRRNTFDSSEEYYGVLFHELIHSTGSKNRLSRKSITGEIVFGSQGYGREELVAEMGSAFLCGHTGIENKVIDNSAAYINSWLSKIRKDSKLVIVAAGQAQKAADYILGRREDG